MALADVLNERIIDLEMDVKNKDEALHHLAGLLKKENYIDDIEEFVADIYKREAEGVTGIGNHIAIPHGKSDSVTSIGIAIGRTKEPIEWESLDGEPVSIIFLFCVSNNTDYARNHMLLLAEIAGKLGNDDRVAALQSVREKEDLIQLMTE